MSRSGPLGQVTQVGLSAPSEGNPTASLGGEGASFRAPGMCSRAVFPGKAAALGRRFPLPGGAMVR